MKKTDIINPTAIKFPVAAQGNKNTIPLNPTGTQKASIIGGFPDITMTSIADGGIPPEGKDFNGLFYLATDYKAFLQNGGVITFNQVVSDLIGGYPQDAVLIYYNDQTNVFYHVISLIDDNIYNFVDNSAYIDGEKWKYAETDAYMQGDNIFIDNKVISASGKYPYSFNNGNVDSSGNADLISYSGADVTYKIGSTYPNLIGTKADGQQFEVDAIADDNVSTLADGNYIKYIGSDDTTDLLKNKITVAKVAPSTPSADDVWINNAVSPLTVKKYIEPNYTNNGVSISSDGIATWNGTTDYIDTGVKPDYTQPFKIYTRVCVTNLTQGGRFIGFNGIHDYDNLFGTSKIDDNRYNLYVAIAGTNTGITERIFNLNEVIDILFEFDGTDKYKIYVKTQSDIEYTLIKTLTNSNTIPNTNNLVLGYVDFPKLWGTIDLKEFRVFVDDILFYQPNIDSQGWQNYDKIPLGKITVESGAVTGAESYPYNIDYIGAGGAMPSVKYKALTVLASGGTYTAPANGYFYFSSENGVLQIGNNAAQSLGMQSNFKSGYGAKVFCPVKKGQTVFLRYDGNVTNAYFIYSQDSESEAI